MEVRADRSFVSKETTTKREKRSGLAMGEARVGSNGVTVGKALASKRKFWDVGVSR